MSDIGEETAVCFWVGKYMGWLCFPRSPSATPREYTAYSLTYHWKVDA